MDDKIAIELIRNIPQILSAIAFVISAIGTIVIAILTKINSKKINDLSNSNDEFNKVVELRLNAFEDKSKEGTDE